MAAIETFFDSDAPARTAHARERKARQKRHARGSIHEKERIRVKVHGAHER